MAGTLTNLKIKDTYKSILKIGSADGTGAAANANVLHATTLKIVEDGDGNDSPIQIAQNRLEIVPVANHATAFEVSQADGTQIFNINSTTPGLTINAATVTLTQDTDFVTSSENGMSIDGTTFSVDGNNNRVGIGTAAPATPLHVKSTDSDGVTFTRSSVDIGLIDFSNNDYNIISSTNHLRFSVPNGKYFTFATGNVGIGTTSPSGTLQVTDTNQAVVAILENDTDGISDTHQMASIYFGAEDPAGTARYGAAIKALAAEAWSAGGTDNGTDLIFYTCDNGTDGLDPRMTILDDGKVGIGVTDPDVALEVKGESSTPTWISVEAPTDNYDAGFVIKSNDTIRWQIFADGSASDRYRIADLSGDGVYIAQDHSGTAWTDGSDLRLKTDISLITDALTKVNSIRGVNFKWKKYKEGASNPNPDYMTADEWADMRPQRDINRVGVIAQEVNEVLPEAVDKSSDDEWGVSYPTLVPLLIEAVKELSAKVTALENA